MNFQEIFNSFLEHEKELKVVSVASCDKSSKPNSAHKMLVDVHEPNVILFLDYNHTQTYGNMQANPQLSVSFMDDAGFAGYRLTGTAEVLKSGSKEFEEARKSWNKKLISYEADRIIRRVQGQYSTRNAENKLPPDFVIVKFIAKEASTIMPDRVLRAKAT